MMPSQSLATLLIVVGLCGCAAVPQPDPERSQVMDSLAYFHRISTAPPDVQRREYADANVAHELSADNETRLRLALLLLLPGTPWRDDARASQLLGALDLPVTGQTSPRRDMAFLLDRLIQTRRDDVRKCEQRLEAVRDERRKAEQRMESVRDECKRADVLQQKLDELRDIDRDLRNKRPSRRTRP